MYTHDLYPTYPKQLIPSHTHTLPQHSSAEDLRSEMTAPLSPIARGKGLIFKPPLKPSSRCKAPSPTHTRTKSFVGCHPALIFECLMFLRIRLIWRICFLSTPLSSAGWFIGHRWACVCRGLLKSDLHSPDCANRSLEFFHANQPKH